MKKAILILLCFLLFPKLYAQEGNPDLGKIFETAYNQQISGQYSEAIQNYSKLLNYDLDPEIKRQLLIKRGLAYNSLEDYSSAVEDFTESIKLDSTDMASFVDRGLSNYYRKHLDEAEIDFKFVLKNNSDKKMSENSGYWLTKIEFIRGNFNKATEYCNQLIANNKNDAEFYFLRGTAFSNQFDFNKAIEDYDKAIEINPNYMEALTNRGVVKINLLTGKGNLNPTKKETKSACQDLKKASGLGDIKNTEDLIFVYCN